MYWFKIIFSQKEIMHLKCFLVCKILWSIEFLGEKNYGCEKDFRVPKIFLIRTFIRPNKPGQKLSVEMLPKKCQWNSCDLQKMVLSALLELIPGK